MQPSQLLLLSQTNSSFAMPKKNEISMMVCVVADNKEKKFGTKRMEWGLLLAKVMMVTSTSGSQAYPRIPDKETPF